MTRFVESFATQQLLPPWKATRAQVSGFAIRLQEKLILEYLNKYFNGPYPDYAPYRYEPLRTAHQFGLLTVCHYPNIASSLRGPDVDPVSGGRAWDHIRHTEIYLAFPVYRYPVTADGLITEPTLVWVQPAAYSDNDTIVFSSREIWGTDMFLATIERVSGAPDEFHVDAGMVAIKTFDARSVDQLLAFLHIRATEKDGLDLPTILKANSDLQEFVDILGGSGVFQGDRLPPGVQATRRPEGVELNNLKQFRDCYDMGAAIYRAIVASRTSYTNVGDIVFYDTSGIDIAFMWSDSLGEFLKSILGAEKPSLNTPNPGDLGPPPEHADDWSEMDWDMDRVVIRAELGFAFVADIDFEVLATIHTYGEAT